MARLPSLGPICVEVVVSLCLNLRRVDKPLMRFFNTTQKHLCLSTEVPANKYHTVGSSSFPTFKYSRTGDIQRGTVHTSYDVKMVYSGVYCTVRGCGV
jgi:hypothetical protein